MKKINLSAVLLVLLYMATSANALACSCLGEEIRNFWDLVSPASKNAMVKFDKLVPGGESGYWYGKFVVLDKFNTPDFKVNDTITMRSVSNTCGVYMPAMTTGDTLLVALGMGYELYAGCLFNSIGVRNGHVGIESLEEVKTRIMTITYSPKNLAAQHKLLVYPNPASSFLIVKASNAGRFPVRIEILDMNGKVVKTKEPASAEESLDIQLLPKGLYLLKLSYNDQIPVLRKWVKE